jgi:hypothetical protein
MSYDPENLKTDGVITGKTSGDVAEFPMDGFGMDFAACSVALPSLKETADKTQGPNPYVIVDGKPVAFRCFALDSDSNQLRGIGTPLDYKASEMKDLNFRLLTPDWLQEALNKTVQASQPYVGNRYDSLLVQGGRV